MPLALGPLTEGGCSTGTGTGIQLYGSHLGQDGNSSFGSVPPVTLVLKVQMQLHIKTAQPRLTAPPSIHLCRDHSMEVTKLLEPAGVIA